MFGRALLGEKFALMRLEDALQNFSTLRRLGIGDAHSGNIKSLFGIPLRIGIANAKGRLRDKAEAPPFKIGAQLKNFSHCAQSRAVSFPWDDTPVLVLDLRFATVQLPQKHHDRLEHVERFKA